MRLYKVRAYVLWITGLGWGLLMKSSGIPGRECYLDLEPGSHYGVEGTACQDEAATTRLSGQSLGLLLAGAGEEFVAG